jgi:hypothetical protein
VDDLVWWITNSIFSALLWLLIDRDGQEVLKILYSLGVVIIFILAYKEWSKDEED